MNIDRDKFLDDCVGNSPNYNDFFEWSGFGTIWEWAVKQEWWTIFVDKYFGYKEEFKSYLINPNIFADAIYKFLKEHKYG